MKHQLKVEATKQRDFTRSRLLNRELISAAKALKENQDIIVRQADKANLFVVMNKSDYKNKLDEILNDSSKFQRITRNPTVELKTEVNKLIKTVNREADQKVLSPIIGEFSPGYLYGTIKTHKPGNPLRPIISQISTPTYQVAKQLNAIITPYLPAKYQINSTDEFLDILKATQPRGELFSIDAVSLFTNVPILQTIDIICDATYKNSQIPPPAISEANLRKLLIACTTKNPFTHIDGTLYLQKEGVSMGSPLGVTFANFYMVHIENIVLQNSTFEKPHIYCRYVDDCFVATDSLNNLIKLRDQLEATSVLRFTYEQGLGNRLNFLDVDLKITNQKFETTIYNKPTNSGIYLNATSECPQRYKTGTIKNLIHRTCKTLSNWELFHRAVENLNNSSSIMGTAIESLTIYCKNTSTKQKKPKLRPT